MLSSKAIYTHVTGISAGISMVLIAAWTGFHLHFNLSSATSLDLLLVILVALRWGFLEASITSFLSVAFLDYFFTQPLFVFYIADRQEWLALAIFESVALLVSRISIQIKAHSSDAETQRMRMQKLYDLSQSILLLDRHQPTEPQIVGLIRTKLDVEGVALWDAYEIHLYVSGNCTLEEQEVRSVYFSEKDEDDPSRGIYKRVLRIGTRATGSLIFCGQTLDTSSINAAASLAAIAIERARSFSAESNAEAAKQSEQLRSTVLDALAHAYKTPLATIKSSSSGLLTVGSLTVFQKELITLIDNEAEHLNNLTNQLLGTAELDRNSLRLSRCSVNLFELVSDITRQYKQGVHDHSIQVDATKSRILTYADPHLLRMAVEQLLDNAVKYAPPQSGITIRITEEEVENIIGVHNQGTYIAPEERNRIFNRFYRSPGTEHRASGTGIGLSIVRRIVSAHQGRLWVDSDPEYGTAFFLALPQIAKEV